MTTSEILIKREHINQWFGTRFMKERQLQEYKGVIQGSYVDVDLSNLKTKKFKDVDELLVIAIIPKNSTFIGMTGDMSLCQVSLDVIQK
jgi:hypothetical protein